LLEASLCLNFSNNSTRNTNKFGNNPRTNYPYPVPIVPMSFASTVNARVQRVKACIVPFAPLHATTTTTA
jgi:hypothetical protein